MAEFTLRQQKDFVWKHFSENHKKKQRIDFNIQEELPKVGLDYHSDEYEWIEHLFQQKGLITIVAGEVKLSIGAKRLASKGFTYTQIEENIEYLKAEEEEKMRPIYNDYSNNKGNQTIAGGDISGNVNQTVGASKTEKSSFSNRLQIIYWLIGIAVAATVLYAFFNK